MKNKKDFYGAIAFSAHKTSFISKAIRWFTKSNFSHTFIIWRPCPESGYLTIEANDFEVAISPLKKFQKPEYYVEIWKPKVDEEDIEATFKKLFKGKLLFNIGDTYGYLQLLGFAMCIMLKKIGIRRRNNIFSQGAICSEIVFRYMADLPPFRQLYNNPYLPSPDLISPEDVYRIINDIYPDKFELVAVKEFGSLDFKNK